MKGPFGTRTPASRSKMGVWGSWRARGRSPSTPKSQRMVPWPGGKAVGLVGKQLGTHLTWVLMTGHLLVLRIQWPQRRSSFPKLHVQVLSSPRGCYSHTALFLSLASRVVAAAAVAATVGVQLHTQTLGSWGLAPRTTRDLSFSRVRYLWRLVLKSIPFKC